MKQGTMVDATIIVAPDSTKNECKRFLEGLLRKRSKREGSII